VEIAIGAAALFLAIGGLITAIISMRKVHSMAIELKDAEVEQIRKSTAQRNRDIQLMSSKVKNMEDAARVERLENKEQSTTH
jgi:hypothetical protein